MSASSNACVFCNEDGGEVIWSNALARVVRVDDADHPAFCRVIAQRHVREMTDLDEAQRAQMMRIVFAVEQAQRKLLSPQKVNLASFGNMVPHVHWHVVPRFVGDPHYPHPVWGKHAGGTAQPLPDQYWQRFVEELQARLS